MPSDSDGVPDRDRLLFVQCDVFSRQQALQFWTPSAIRHRVARGVWQHPHRGVYVASAADLTARQKRWIAVLASPGSLLGGRTALEEAGLDGFESPTVDLILPGDLRFDRPPIWVRTHRTRHLLGRDLRAWRVPRRTANARSVVDAARWAVSDNEARVVIAIAVQQRLVAERDVIDVLRRLPRVRRSQLIRSTATDAFGGAHSLAELGFLALSRRAGLPEPKLQVGRRDASGRRRLVDVLYEDYGVLVEIDGIQHLDARQAWADMKRQNDLWVSGLRVLRFPSWLIRERPDEVIEQVRRALIAAGWPG